METLFEIFRQTKKIISKAAFGLCWPLLPRNATSDLITAFHCRNIFPKRTRISLQPSCVYPGNRFLILDQTIFNSMRPSPVPLVTCTTSCRLRHGFKTEEPRRRDWRMKRIRVYRFDSKEVSCRKTEGKSMIDEELLVLFCEMFHAWLNTMLSFTDCLSVAASLEEDVISLSFTGQSMISWDSLRETAVAANWPKMIVGDADKQWQALLVEETAWELGFLISEVDELDVLSQPRQLASSHLLL